MADEIYNEQIKVMIRDVMDRGVRVFRGKAGFGKRGETGETDILCSVITRLELNRLNTEIRKIDPDTLVVMSSVKDTKGGMIKKRSFRH